MWEILVRFIAGGIIISVFALIGDVLKPKSFAGLFGAAPSVALVTLFVCRELNQQIWANRHTSPLLGPTAHERSSSRL